MMVKKPCTRERPRYVRLHPYKRGKGPMFTLSLWDTGQRDPLNKAVLAYHLRQDGKTLFKGDDFATPHRPVDSDQNVEELLGFLTLKPLDGNYTSEQYTFVRDHAECLACEAERRFGGGN